MNFWVNPLFICDQDFDRVWQRDAENPILVVLGSGFDPRSTVTLERILNATKRRIDALVVHLPESSTDLNVRPRAQVNQARIERLVKLGGGVVRHQMLPEAHDNGSLGRLISRQFQASGLLEQYAEVVIEISAMPRSIFFPLVRGVLQRAHLPSHSTSFWGGDFHVAVCENPEADEVIFQEGTSPMGPIGGFSGERKQNPITKIWVPVLGERALSRVESLYAELKPDETYPVLPWPSKDPKRGDRLVLEYRKLLFEDIRLEPRNVIYASERNPFDLYRTLGKLHQRYVESLQTLGFVSMVLSSHSSKLLSMGVLLTAYEFDLEVLHVSPGTYGLRDGADELRAKDEVFDLWLTGGPYR